MKFVAILHCQSPNSCSGAIAQTETGLHQYPNIFARSSNLSIHLMYQRGFKEFKSMVFSGARNSQNSSKNWKLQFFKAVELKIALNSAARLHQELFSTNTIYHKRVNKCRVRKKLETVKKINLNMAIMYEDCRQLHERDVCRWWKPLAQISKTNLLLWSAWYPVVVWKNTE